MHGLHRGMGRYGNSCGLALSAGRYQSVLPFPSVEPIFGWGYSPLFFLSFGVLNVLYYRYWYRKKYSGSQRIDFLLPVFLIFILFIAPLLFFLLVESLSFEPIPTT